MPIFGHDKIGADVWGGYPIACLFTLTGRASIKSMSCYLADGSPPSNVIFGIYSDNAGTPNVLLGQTETYLTSPVDLDVHWVTLNLLTPLLLEAGSYWLAECDSGAGVVKMIDAGGEFVNRESLAWPFPDPFGDVDLQNGTLCIYATYSQPFITVIKQVGPDA